MGKVHPLPIVEVAEYVTSKRESFTIWMKSLVMQGNGCTVFNENGEIAYRIDNYDNRGSNEVYLMDLRGKVLFTILRKVWLFGGWKGYRGDNGDKLHKETPRFQVSKKGQITLLSSSSNAEASCYKLEAGKSAFKIVDCSRGDVVAEARRKQSSNSGVLLGDDVLTLVVFKALLITQMAKVRPLPISVEAASKRESFTVWMKSLVMQGNGCTVFNENGEIVYRIDNYDNKGGNEVYLMDLRGNVLFTILRRVRVFGRLWRGYKGDNNGSNLNKEKPSFEVTKKGEITLLSNNEASCYKLKLEAASATGRTKSAALFKIIECGRGVVVAEGMRKQSRSGSGVLLGDDVLTLSVQPHVDRSFIMALVTVYGLMNHLL
ncbi:hypothetical protein WN943_013199 [Citrus x changshan-huyou]